MTLGLRAYRTLTASAGPLFTFILKRRTLRGKEDPDRVSEKQGIASAARPESPLVWLHGASVGESLSMLPLIKCLSEAQPNLRFLVTTGTLTSAELMAKRLPPSACHQFVPLDHPTYWGRFFSHWRPDLAVIIESELWPNMIAETCARDIPLVLANARLSEKSAKGWNRVGRSIASLLSSFDVVLAQDERSATRLSALGADPVETPGNLKFDAPPLQADTAALEDLRAQIGGRPCWVAASTHEGEETLVGRIHVQLQKAFPDLLTILAPRHPARGPAVARDMEELGLNVAQRSKSDVIKQDTNVYLADTLGEMGLVFRLAPIAFIGGSFVDVGGHNPLEAARLDTAILFGPHMFNFEDATTPLRDAGAAIQVTSEADLTDRLSKWLATSEEASIAAAQGKEVVSRSTHVAARITQKLLPLLPDTAKSKVKQ
ncbi:3-deoxy-D-manno-octulosonic acid transferase [Parvibaculaceae bacterium PLY_AMNH_Bact1]|nr:3-deoxy-D-manno-octulosonic acid transferase [Parvibaculaceae bacterium PLY_AMNH_Bact1]